MGSMHTMLEETPGGQERAARFYAERARAHVGLIVTGGISPTEAGVVFTGSAKLSEESEVPPHQLITEAVHREGGNDVRFSSETDCRGNRLTGKHV